MKSYIAFTKKEFCENIRTYKCFIMLMVFLLIGIMNPVTAKILPKILNSMMSQMEGIKMTIAEPTALDSWMQFFKNVPQMGLIVLVVVFSGIMTNEFNKGTLINMLTKGLSRKIVILSKFTMATSVWTISYIICFITTYGYTMYLWGNEGINNLLISVVSIWVFGILLISTVILGGVIFRNIYGALLSTGGVVVMLTIINLIPKIEEYNPLKLTTENMQLITNKISNGDFITPIVVSILISILFIISSISIFNKSQV